MSEETFQQLKGLNITEERFGAMPEDDRNYEEDIDDGGIMLDPMLIVNKEVFNLLVKRFPRIRAQFIPIFKK